MSAATVLPGLYVQTDYKTWLNDVRQALANMNMDMKAWQENWEFDFRREYDAASEPCGTAVHAHDFWWQQLLAESWT
jgi:hypothetical protein